MEVVPLSVSSESDLALPGDIKAMQRHMFVIQFARLLGLHEALDREQKLILVEELMLRYKHALEFGELTF